MRHRARLERLERLAAGVQHVPGELAELERLIVAPGDAAATWWRWITFTRWEALACLVAGRGDRAELLATVLRCERQTADIESNHFERSRRRLAAESHLLAVGLFAEPQLRQLEAFRLEQEPGDPLFDAELTDYCHQAYGPGVHVRGRRAHPWAAGHVEILDGETVLATGAEFWDANLPAYYRFQELQAERRATAGAA